MAEKLDIVIGVDNKKALKSLSNVGKAFGLLTIAVGTYAVKSAIEFEKSMASVATLLDGDVNVQLERLNEGVLDLATESSRSLNELSEGMFYVVSAGIAMEDQLEYLRIGAELATAGNTQVATSLKAVTSFQKAYGDESESAAVIADYLFTINKKGITTFEEIANAIPKVTSSANLLGVSQLELSAAMTTLVGVTGNADEVTTQLQGTFNALGTPSANMTVALNEMGFASGFAAVESIGLIGTLEGLREQAGGTDEGMSTLFNNVRAKNGVMPLAGVLVDKFSESLVALEQSEGAAAEAARIMDETTANQYANLKNNLTVILTELAVSVLPDVTEKIKTFSDGIRGLRQISEIHQDQLEASTALYKELDSAVEGSTGVQKEFLEMYTEAAKLQMMADDRREQGHESVANNIMEKRNEEIVSIKKWVEENRTALDNAGLYHDDLSMDVLASMMQIDKSYAKSLNEAQKYKDVVEDSSLIASNAVSVMSGKINDVTTQSNKVVSTSLSKMSKSFKEFEGDAIDSTENMSMSVSSEMDDLVSQSGAWGSDLTGDFSSGMSSQLPSVSSAVSSVEGTVNDLNELPTSIWGSHLMDNFIYGIESKYGELGATTSHVIGIMKRLQFSTNEEMPTEIWGQHSMENFAIGMLKGGEKVSASTTEMITIVNAWGQDVEVEVGNVISYWDGYANKVEDVQKSQAEMFTEGVQFIGDLSKEIDSRVSDITETLGVLSTSLDGIFSEYASKDEAQRTELAQAVVQTEEEILSLKEQIANEENEARRNGLMERLRQEQEALTVNKELFSKIEREITEVKRVNELTRLERAVETFEEEQKALEEWKNAAIAAWQEQAGEAGVALDEIKTMWADRTEKVKSLMDDEMSKNADLKMAIADSSTAVLNLISHLDELKRKQQEMGMTVGMSNIPHLADGGVVNEPTLALIGEAGPEAVIPLNKSGLILNESPSAGTTGGVSTSNITIVVDTFIGTEEFAENVGNTILGKLKEATVIQGF